MSTIDEKQVIEFLRSKANAFNAAADALEGKSAVEKPATPRVIVRSQPPTAAPPDFSLVSGHPTMEDLQKRIRRKSARIAQLAHEFNCSDITIQALIDTPNSGLIVAERGWVKLDDDDFV